ncbi:predicted protein [Naegleria gruberi]|uniref:Predicted protein n=1 Tax=Naegleria gruberi TaxID=5762 RepID=D2V9U3_NAEGR|nr:uncharacterized protein NAEGRDRAFT_47807 [Naegleria gruberi]EFC46307.1 predicted protein [Naegleria gruberi]|eukprot:XP_002679051.1 predicted protein [Naegleria gruberi strain NEG-M]
MKRDSKFYTDRYMNYCKTLYHSRFIESKEREYRKQNPIIRPKKTPYEMLSTDFSRKLVEEYKKGRKNSKAFKPKPEEIRLERERKLETAKELYLNEQFVDAAALFKECIKEDMNGPEVYNMLGESLWRAGNYQESIEFLSVCLEKDPFVSSAYFVRGDCYVHLQDFDQGRREFEKYLKIEHPTKTVLVSLGKCCSTLQDLNGAFDSFNRIINDVDDQDPYIYFLRGDVLSQLGYLDDAKKDFKKIRDLDPQFCAEYEKTAANHEKNGEIEDAISIYEALVKVNSDSIEYLNHYGHLLLIIGRIEDALFAFSSCIDKKPLDNPPLLVDSYVSKATILMDRNETDKAMFCLNMAIGELPDEPALYKSRGSCFLLSGSIKDTVEDFEMLYQLDSSKQYIDGFVYKILGEYYFNVENNIQLSLDYFIESFKMGYLGKLFKTKEEELNRAKIGSYTTYLIEETKIQYICCLLNSQNSKDRSESPTETPEEDKKKAPPKKEVKKPVLVSSLFDLSLNTFIKKYDGYVQQEIPTINTKDVSRMLKLYRERNGTSLVPPRSSSKSARK